MPPLLPARRQRFGFAFWMTLCFLAAALGSFGSLNAGTFYNELATPVWAPPGWLFGPVWSLLYAMMAIAAWLVWRQGGWANQQRALTLFIAQLAVNASWSWVFFTWQRGDLAFLTILLLIALLVPTIIRFARTRISASLLLLPYLVWVVFAAALNWHVWQLNPSLLG